MVPLAARAVDSGWNSLKPRAMVSAFTNSCKFARGRSAGAEVDLPAPYGPAMMATWRCSEVVESVLPITIMG